MWRRVWRWGRGGQGVVALTTTLGVLWCTACEFGRTTVALGRPVVVVHAVLNPAQPVEEILVEQALTGVVEVDTTPSYDPTSPITTGGGIPLSGATVIVYTADGDSAVAREGFPEGGGAGVYLIANSAAGGDTSPVLAGTPSLRFMPGARYRLRVVTTDGDVVTGAATIPDAGAAPLDTVGVQQSLDRSRDTLTLHWPAARLARSYLVQIGTPFNTFSRLADTLGVALPGDTRNTDARAIPHLFIPGFVQVAIVGAVDSNYYDYVRYRSDVSLTATRVNHLAGGVGVFGAYLPLLYRAVVVTAPFVTPLDGAYQRAAGSTPAVPSQIVLYVESPAGDNGLAQLSGNYTASNGVTGGVIGVFDGTNVTLDVLRGESVLDTALVIDGQWRGDTIAGSVRGGGRVTYVHRATP